MFKTLWQVSPLIGVALCANLAPISFALIFDIRWMVVVSGAAMLVLCPLLARIIIWIFRQQQGLFSTSLANLTFSCFIIGLILVVISGVVYGYRNLSLAVSFASVFWLFITAQICFSLWHSLKGKTNANGFDQ
jgi:hypothetical protein